MRKTKFLDRVMTFFWWNIMAMGWLIGIFSQKIYSFNEEWLKSVNEEIAHNTNNMQKRS